MKVTKAQAQANRAHIVDTASALFRERGYDGIGVADLMAAAGFLALAHTLKRGEHIRVTLVINALRGTSRKALEVWALVVALLLAMLFAYYSCRLAWQSYTFHDISTGNDATPLWIPQLSMAWGTVVLAIAFLDELVLELRGQRRVPASGEMLRNE